MKDDMKDFTIYFLLGAAFAALIFGISASLRERPKEPTPEAPLIVVKQKRVRHTEITETVIAPSEMGRDPSCVCAARNVTEEP